METRRRKDPFCGDIVNSLTCQEKDFHWSIAYHCFLSLNLKQKLKKNIWTIALVNVDCMTEFFYFKEMIT
jgi:hypothetical protein